MARKPMTLLFDLKDRFGNSEDFQQEVEVDTRQLGKGETAEIANIGQQICEEIEPDLANPPATAFRVRGVNEGHIFEECDGAKRRPWWKI